MNTNPTVETMHTCAASIRNGDVVQTIDGFSAVARNVHTDRYGDVTFRAEDLYGNILGQRTLAPEHRVYIMRRNAPVTRKPVLFDK